MIKLLTSVWKMEDNHRILRLNRERPTLPVWRMRERKEERNKTLQTSILNRMKMEYRVDRFHWFWYRFAGVRHSECVCSVFRGRNRKFQVHFWNVWQGTSRFHRASRPSDHYEEFRERPLISWWSGFQLSISISRKAQLWGVS